jgi:ribosome-associated protein
MKTEALQKLVIEALEELKVTQVTVLDVRGMTSVTDVMVVATGTSNRHVKSLADNVQVKVKQAGVMPIGTEGEQQGEWVLVDLGDLVVHVMLPSVRDFYNLEKLWDKGLAAVQAARGG